MRYSMSLADMLAENIPHRFWEIQIELSLISDMKRYFLFSDVNRVATFSSRFSLPAVYRSHVWKIVLGKK